MEYEYQHHALKREPKKALIKLKGILTGITIDYEMNDEEIIKLKDWMDHHDYLLLSDPFYSLSTLLQRCLKDGVIDESEREEILDWCLEFIDQPAPKEITTAILNLHGVLEGIVCDAVITEQEVIDLHDWIQDYELFKNDWPFNEVWRLLEKIFEDSVVTEDEKQELLIYCMRFTEQYIQNPRPSETQKTKHAYSNAPVVKSFQNLCDRCHIIDFKDKHFCFTGTATLPRRKLHEIVESCGGIPKKNISLDLHYLIIGAQSTPAWAYATYGRKVEKVMTYNEKRNLRIVILHEDDFLSQSEALLDSL